MGKLTLGQAKQKEIISEDDATVLLEEGVLSIHNNNVDEINELLDKEITLQQDVKDNKEKSEEKTNTKKYIIPRRYNWIKS